MLVDTGPLRRFPQYRRLWSGFLVSTLGNQLTVVAVPYQVYALTRSSFDVGLVSLVQLGPLLVGALVGGTLADALDRRRLLAAAQVLLASTSVGLALNAASTRPALWPLFVCSACQAGFSGISNPTRTAIVVSVVDRPSLVSANALWQALFQFGQIGGPALGGVLIGRLGVGGVYWIDVASYGAAIAFVLRLRLPPRPAGGPRRELGFRSVAGGLAYLRGHQVLQSVFLVDLNAMVFGLPRALFPALGIARFHGGAGTVGLLYAAPGVGALAAALSTGWVAALRRQGRAVLIAVAAWGAAITAFGLVGQLWLGLVLLGLAGGADVVSAVLRATILQTVAPEGLLGRLQAVQTAVVAGGPRLGDLEAGSVAALAGTEASVVSGGLLCLAGVVVLARLLPRFAALQLHARPGAGRAHEAPQGRAAGPASVDAPAAVDGPAGVEG